MSLPDGIVESELVRMTETILDVFGKRPGWFARRNKHRTSIIREYITSDFAFEERHRDIGIPISHGTWVRVHHYTLRVLIDYARTADGEAFGIMIAQPHDWHNWQDEFLKVFEKARDKIRKAAASL